MTVALECLLRCCHSDYVDAGFLMAVLEGLGISYYLFPNNIMVSSIKYTNLLSPTSKEICLFSYKVPLQQTSNR